MTKRSTKKSLVLSCLALLLCFSMLIGTTFAWFTDSVTSSGNKIVSGTLKVDLELLDKETGVWSSLKESKAPIFNYENWEPGYVDAKVLKVENEGSLALKWKAKFVSTVELSALANVIDVYVLPSATEIGYPADRNLEGYQKVGTVAEFVNTIEETTYGNLLAGECAYLGIALKMQETAGNEYQDMDLGGAFDIQIVATQMAHENDSFGPDYDADAEFDGEISSVKGLRVALQKGGSYRLVNDIAVTDGTSLVIEEGIEVALALNGKSITNPVLNNAALINNGTLTITGEGSIANTTTKEDVVASGETVTNASKTILNTGKLVIEEGLIGSVNTPGNAVANKGGEVIINGGTFASRGETKKGEGYAAYAFLNDGGTMVINNATVKDPTHGLFGCYAGTLTVNGGNYTLTGDFACYITYTTEGVVEINGGNITVENTRNGYFMYAYNGSSQFGYKNVMDNTDSVVVTGGVFTNKSAHTIDWNYIAADGYQAVKSGDAYYIVPDSVKGVITDAASLNEALTNAGAAGAGNTTVVILSDIDMTDVAWKPIDVDGYHGADIVTVEGNGHTITGLTAPLFAGGFAGGSGIVIKDLTIADSDIVSTNTTGSGAFIESVDSMDTITLNNCHLLNSTVTGGDGSRTGGLIGWTAGYNNQNDGPVKTYVNITNCSVVGCTITCNGSVGGIYGHAGNNAWTYSTVENCTVQDCVLNSTDDGGWRVGVVVGTANVGELAISGITESGNILTQTGKTAPAGQSNLYGRFVPGSTGKLVIDGAMVLSEASGEALNNAITSGVTNLYLPAGEYTMPSTSSDVTISGTKDTVIALPFNSVSGNGNVITFEGVTIKGETDSSWYSTLFNGASKVVYKDCVIYDQLTTYCDSEFVNCTFYNTFDNDYSVYCYSGKNITFEGCTFNTVCGKAVKVYDEGNGGRTVTVDSCTFNAEIEKKAAVEIDSTYSTYYVYINNCTLEGAFDAAWNSDAGEDAGTNVCLNGEWVKGNAPA